MNYIKQIFIALDQLINTLLGGWADETLSSRAYRYSMIIGASFWHKIPCKVIDTVFFWDCGEYEGLKIGHCELSYISEKERLQCAPEFRE